MPTPEVSTDGEISKLSNKKVTKGLAKYDDNDSNHYNDNIREDINRKDCKEAINSNCVGTHILSNKNIKWWILEFLGPIFLTFLSLR